MELHEALDKVRFDQRLLDWNLKQGLIKEAEVKKHLESLPDLKSQSATVDLSFDLNGNGSSHPQYT